MDNCHRRADFFFSSRRRHTRLTCDWFRRVLFRSGAAWQPVASAAIVRSGVAELDARTERRVPAAAGKASMATRGELVRDGAPDRGAVGVAAPLRSEERRVGEEGRSAWAADDEDKK